MYEARLKNIVWIMERGEEGVRKRKEDRREEESEGGREEGGLGFPYTNAFLWLLNEQFKCTYMIRLPHVFDS